MNDYLLTVKETADLLKVHWQTVRKYLKDGTLKRVRIGRNIRIKNSDVLFLIDKTKINLEKYEIELRFAFKNGKKVKERLMSLGAEVIYHGHVIDHWFVPNSIKNLKEKNKWFDSAKGYGLRIREQDNGYTGKIFTSLEVKRLLLPDKHDTCIEEEIDVNNYESTAKLLRLANFKEFVVINKDRLFFKYKEVKVAVDVLKDFLTAIEIEKVTSNNRKETLHLLKSIAIELGIDIKKDITDKSVTYMAMEKFAKF